MSLEAARASQYRRAERLPAAGLEVATRDREAERRARRRPATSQEPTVASIYAAALPILKHNIEQGQRNGVKYDCKLIDDCAQVILRERKLQFLKAAEEAIELCDQYLQLSFLDRLEVRRKLLVRISANESQARKYCSRFLSLPDASAAVSSEESEDDDELEQVGDLEETDEPEETDESGSSAGV